jgi:hypothetical protein
VKTLPSALRTVFGVGPGVKVSVEPYFMRTHSLLALRQAPILSADLGGCRMQIDYILANQKLTLLANPVLGHTHQPRRDSPHGASLFWHRCIFPVDLMDEASTLR